MIAAAFMTVDAVASHLGCSRWHVDELIHSGALPASDIGTKPKAMAKGKKAKKHRPTWRVAVADLERFLRDRRPVPSPDPVARTQRLPEVVKARKWY
jgi:excisionase family DNA binding protein